MAIYLVLGATEMGKSWLIENRILKQYKKTIAYDPRHSFKGDVLTSPTAKEFQNECFDRFALKDSYHIALRKNRLEQPVELFDRSVPFATGLGRASLKKDGSRILYVVDETATICSSRKKSEKLEFLIQEGRHEGVDTLFVAQYPYNITPLIRSQATTTISFFLKGASGMDEMRRDFTAPIAKKIELLPKYHYVTVEQNGLITITNEKGKVYETFNKK